MKRLIRSRTAKLFLTAAGTWTRDPEQAQVFPSDQSARKVREEFRLQGCELYFLVGQEPSSGDFALALERL